MISNQILQNTIEGIKSISRVDLYVADTDGKIVASTSQVGEQFGHAIMSFVASPADSQSVQEYQFFKVYDENQLELILIAQGTSDDVFMVGKMAAFQIQNLLVAYKERFDKDNFVKNLLLDNLLLVDIYNRAKKLHIDVDARRCVCIIETKNEKDSVALETVRTLFSGQKKDFITAVDEKSIILVKHLDDKQGYEEVERIANTIVDMLNTEAMVNVAYGTIVKEMKEVSRSYKEARMALDVGKIFFSTKSVVAYNNLGIGRLIYQLPIPLCKMFIKIKKVFASFGCRSKLFLIDSFQIPAIGNPLKIVALYSSILQINPIHLNTMHSRILFHFHIFFLIEQYGIYRITTE